MMMMTRARLTWHAHWGEESRRKRRGGKQDAAATSSRCIANGPSLDGHDQVDHLPELALPATLRGVELALPEAPWLYNLFGDAPDAAT